MARRPLRESEKKSPVSFLNLARIALPFHARTTPSSTSTINNNAGRRFSFEEKSHHKCQPSAPRKNRTIPEREKLTISAQRMRHTEINQSHQSFRPSCHRCRLSA